MPSLRLQHITRSARPGLLDTFLVAAVLTILTIRVYLKAANYPQIGGRGLHVAHVLWGGLGMMIAIVILLAFLGEQAQRLAAVVGGIGFGAFIDELGKFVTADNNYFFKPTAALVYTILVVIFLATRQIRRVRRLTPEENLVNAIDLSKDLATDTLSLAERDRALTLLAAADQANLMVAPLRAQFLAASGIDEGRSRVTSIAAAGQRRYGALVATRWFHRAIAAIFILEGLVVVQGTIAMVLGRGGPGSLLQEVSSLIVGGVTTVGVVSLRQSRLRAYRWFEFAVLVDLLLAQPFTLLAAGFAGLVKVFIDLALLVTLRYMIGQEKQLAARAARTPDEPGRYQPGLPS